MAKYKPKIYYTTQMQYFCYQLLTAFLFNNVFSLYFGSKSTPRFKYISGLSHQSVMNISSLAWMIYIYILCKFVKLQVNSFKMFLSRRYKNIPDLSHLLPLTSENLRQQTSKLFGFFLQEQKIHVRWRWWNLLLRET